MKKTIAFCATLLTIGITTLISCNKKEEVSMPKQDKVNHLSTYGPDYSGYNSTSGERDLVIISFVPHKPSLNCMYGWGICHFRFLPGIINYDNINVPVTSEFNGGNLNIFLSEDVSRYTQEELLLEVESDVYSEDPNSLMESSFKVVAGDYEYNSSLGQYGGYTILIEKI